MLKKVGIAAALATVGVLALSPFALADDEDQDNHQFATQGEGKGNGHNYGSGFGAQLICDENITGGNHPEAPTTQGDGACNNTMVQEDQVKSQHKSND